MKVLVIVPAYNEALNIIKTVNDITDNCKFDYLVINDCSRDNTESVCKENGFNYISLPINYGLTSVVQFGMKYAKKYNYDVVIQFDGDGQHNAKYLKNIVDKIEKDNCDIVIGSRFVTEKKPHSLRMLGSNIIQLFIKLTTGKTIKDPTSGMRGYNKDAINEFIANSSLAPEPDMLVYMLKNKMKVEEVQVQMRDREFGESYLKPLKSIEYMFNMVFSILFIRSISRSGRK